MTRYISPLGAWALAFGCSVGWGAFVMPGTTFLPISGPLGTVIGILAGGAVMTLIGVNYNYLMKDCSDAGGTFAYTKKHFGYDHGFLSAWFLFLTYIAIIWANSTALSLAMRFTLGSVFQTGFHYRLAGYDIYLGEALLSISAVLLLGACCMFRRKFAVILQTVMSLVLIIGAAVCFVLVIGRTGSSLQRFSPAFAPDINKVSQVFRVIALVPWAFVGYESISHSSEEFTFGGRKITAVILISVLTISAAYILLTLLAVPAFPAEYPDWTAYIADIGNLNGIRAMPVFNAMYSVMGDTAITAIAIVNMCALFTGILANTIAVSRLLCAMSRDGILPAWFGRLNRDGSPANAALFTIAISSLIPFFGRTVIGWPIDVSTIGAAIAYGYTSASAFRRARAEHNSRMKKTGIAGIVMAVIFCLLLLIPNYLSGGVLAKESYLILAVWCVLGFALFRSVFRKDDSGRFGRSTVVWLALISLIIFSSMMWMRLSTHSLTEQSVKDISEYYSAEDDISDPEQIREESEYLAEELRGADNSMLNYSLTQMGLTVISMIIMFNIYSVMRSRQSKAELEKMRAEENSRAKSFFLSNMSHDLRTPMNAIIGYTELARREGVSVEDMRGYLEKIASSGKHLLTLINDILEMSRIENGRAEPEISETDLRRIMDDMRDMFSTQMSSKNICYTVAVNITDDIVMCDSKRLNRILLNLISNAYKFTPEDGDVYVSLTETSRGEDTGFYELRVKDSGIGMSPEFAEKVFEAFERERTSTVSGIQGTGLGMAITKSFIDMMQGSINVETETGRGTEFIVKLSFPTVPVPESRQESVGSEAHSTADLSPVRLLLAEDNEINREIAVLILEEEGFTIDTAENGQQAVDMIKSAEPHYYGAVLMDVQMPVMNGLDATRAIRALDDERARIPVIAMTANAFAEDIAAEREAGMNAHISKPFDLGEMLGTLSDVLHNTPSEC